MRLWGRGGRAAVKHRGGGWLRSPVAVGRPLVPCGMRCRRWRRRRCASWPPRPAPIACWAAPMPSPPPGHKHTRHAPSHARHCAPCQSNPGDTCRTGCGGGAGHPRYRGRWGACGACPRGRARPTRGRASCGACGALGHGGGAMGRRCQRMQRPAGVRRPRAHAALLRRRGGTASSLDAAIRHPPSAPRDRAAAWQPQLPAERPGRPARARRWTPTQLLQELGARLPLRFKATIALNATLGCGVQAARRRSAAAVLLTGRHLGCSTRVLHSVRHVWKRPGAVRSCVFGPPSRCAARCAASAPVVADGNVRSRLERQVGA